MESLKRTIGNCGTREADGGQGRVQEGADLDVIEADDGDIFRDAQVAPMEPSDGPDGSEIIRGDDCGGTVVQRKEALHGLTSAIDAVVANFNQRFVTAEAPALERGEQCMAASARRRQVHGAADERDAGMAE